MAKVFGLHTITLKPGVKHLSAIVPRIVALCS